MWWQTEICRDSIESLLALLQADAPPHRFESNVERHKVNGQWILVVAFLRLDCELNPGTIATHVISEEVFARACRCAEARRGVSPQNVARQLYGVIEAEEAAERVEASGV